MTLETTVAATGGDGPVRPASGITHGADGMLTVAMELDGEGARLLGAELERFDLPGRPLTVDLRNIDYLSAAGVSVLLEKRSNRLRILLRPGSVPAKVARICGLDQAAGFEENQSHA